MLFHMITKGMEVYFRHSEGEAEGYCKVVRINKFDETVKVRDEQGNEMEAFPEELSCVS